MRVVQDEVADDDGHCEGDHQQPGYGAARPYDVARRRLREHVPVAHRRHGDHAPPEPHGDVGEAVLALREMHEGGEDDHADEEEDEHQHQLVERRLEGVQQDPQARHVTDQPEDPAQPEHAQNEHQVHHGHAFPPHGVEDEEEELHVVRRDRHEVYDVLEGSEEVDLAGRAREAGHVLQREEDQTAQVHDQQARVRQVFLRLLPVALSAAVEGCPQCFVVSVSPSLLPFPLFPLSQGVVVAASGGDEGGVVRVDGSLMEVDELQVEEAVDAGELTHIIGLDAEDGVSVSTEGEDGDEDEDDRHPRVRLQRDRKRGVGWDEGA